MEEFRNLFLRLCREQNVDPQESVVKKIAELSAENSSSGVFDLSNHTLTLATCDILSKVFSHDLAFIAVVLSDCMLNEEGAKILLSGLAKNTTLKTLDLRGNNLRQTGTEALGRYLKNNHTLETLLLEWNALGVWESAFASFCEGLSVNSSLIHLDLRNNQIDHTGAQEIALALKSNSKLSILDLRWNNIGLLGGRAISGALQHNHFITKIDVTGNNIPRDILTSIETSALHNEDRSRLTVDQLRKTRTLTNEIEFLKSEKKKQMIDFMDDLEAARSQLTSTTKSSSNKINNLQEALEERKAALNALRAKLDMCEASLVMSEQKVKDQSAMLELSRRENQDLSKNYENLLRKEREDRRNVENKLNQELESTQDKLSEANAKISDLERKVKVQQDQIISLREDATHAKTEHRLALASADERLASERRRMQAEAREQDEARLREMERLRLEADEARRAAEERAERMRLGREELAKEVAGINAKLVEERMTHDDEIGKLRMNLKAEENSHIEQLQERIRTVQGEKSEVQKQVSSLSVQVAELDASKSALVVEVEGLRRALDGVKRQLATKDQKTEEEIDRVKHTFKKRMNQLEDENSHVTLLRTKVLELESKLNEETARHRESMMDKERVLERVRENLRKTEEAIDRIKDDEFKRATVLQQAVLSYVSDVQTSRSLSSTKLTT